MRVLQLFTCFLLACMIAAAGCQNDPMEVAGQDKDGPIVMAGGGPGPNPCPGVYGYVKVQGPSDVWGWQADMCVYEEDDRYYVWWINGIPWNGNEPSYGGRRGGRNFGFTYTDNFENFAAKDSVELRYFGGGAVADTGWSSEHIWAPTVVKVGSTYYMYYAGTDYGDAGRTDQTTSGATADSIARNRQSIGLATATSLDDGGNWTDYGSDNGWMFNGQSVSWLTYGDEGEWKNDCRDPNVFPVGDDWGMVVSARCDAGGLSICYLTASSMVVHLLFCNFFS